MKFGVGQAVRRTEDVRFVTGRGQYTDDIKLAGLAYGALVRSQHAHARIKRIDTGEALRQPGVLAVLTSDDMRAMGIGALPFVERIPAGDGKPLEMPKTPQPILAEGRVRYAGAPIAFVVAESEAIARGAAELVEVDYDDLPAVGSIERAIAPGAPQIWDEVPGNIVFDWQAGDAAATADAFSRAAYIAEVETYQNRLIVNAMEPRAAIGAYHPDTESYTLHTGTQGANNFQARAAAVLGIPREKLRVITPDVGGGFGMKGFTYPEQILVLAAARRLGRPVKWTGERGEGFLGDSQGRAIEGRARLALDLTGRILALEVDNLADLGAFQHQFGTFIPTLAGARVWGGVYRIPQAFARVRGVFTNTMGVDAYRGAGRPEGTYMIERLMDDAGRLTGLGPIEVRRRNFIRPTDLPYTNWRGIKFEAGEFDMNLTDALKASAYDGFEARRAQARERGAAAGIGVAYYVEITSAEREHSEVRFTENGGAVLIIGTQSNGQGHETTFAQVLSEELGIPFDSITVLQGDTDVVAMGYGTGGSRSAHMTSGAVMEAAKGVIAKGSKVAAHLLDAPLAEISFDRSGETGLFRSSGSNKSVSVPEVAIAARREDLPPDLKNDLGPGGIDSAALYRAETFTLPNGCHICEVEIERETGQVKITRYTVVDDFGRIINPMIVEGQVHGGVVQGIGQALIEHCLYDPQTAQLVTGSFMDYGIPRADDAPPITFKANEMPLKSNPLGVKGCGEAGTVGALAAVANAVIDALSPFGVTDLRMPYTPEKVWRAMQSAQA